MCAHHSGKFPKHSFKTLLSPTITQPPSHHSLSKTVSALRFPPPRGRAGLYPQVGQFCMKTIGWAARTKRIMRTFGCTSISEELYAITTYPQKPRREDGSQTVSVWLLARATSATTHGNHRCTPGKGTSSDKGPSIYTP